MSFKNLLIVVYQRTQYLYSDFESFVKLMDWWTHKLRSLHTVIM